jgi:hypothetical protein
MARRQLDDKLDCKKCGTIQMDIPDPVTDETAIHCSNCGVYLGTWGELQDDFHMQIQGAEVLDLNRGTITETS